jgi:hypothetical protein
LRQIYRAIVSEEANADGKVRAGVAELIALAGGWPAQQGEREEGRSDKKIFPHGLPFVTGSGRSGIREGPRFDHAEQKSYHSRFILL